MLEQVNEVSSYFTAPIATAGRLGRTLLLEPLRRDPLLVWEVLVNPRAVLYGPAETLPRPTVAAAGQDFREYLHFGTGPPSLTEEAGHTVLLQGFKEES